jgi:hypothetical protein
MAEPGASAIRCCRLPMTFAADDLARDLAGIAADAWVAHFNEGYHDGGWSGVSLRGVDGDARTLFPGAVEETSHTDTPLLARCPAIATALSRLLCPVGPVRLLRLLPGGQIREHRDHGLRMELGIARLHVPIATGGGVEFYLGGELVTMQPGECWYLNFDLPHRVQNLGATDRVHLVVDCQVNDWLRAMIASAVGLDVAPDRDSSQARFDRFRARVLDDPALVEALWPIEQPKEFVERVVSLGQLHGFRFTAQEVAAAMQQGGGIGAGRWIVG